MATVYVGSVWNLQECLVISVPIKSMPRNLYPGDLRSGQFRELPIIRLWGNMRMLPVSYKPIKTIQFFQDHGNSPHLCRYGCNWRSGVTWRSPEVINVTIRFSPIIRDRMRHANGAKQLGSSSRFRGMYILTYSGHDLTLTWPVVKFSNWPFKFKKVHVSNRLDKAKTMVSFLFSHLPCQKSY